MRTVQILILRLLIDGVEPPVLRGSVQSALESEMHSFTDEQALLALLRERVARAGKANSTEQSPNPQPDEPHHPA